MKLSYKTIAAASLVLAAISAGFIGDKPQKAPKEIDVGELRTHMNLAELLSKLGAECHLIDSLPTTDVQHHRADVYVIAPVSVLGYQSIAHAEFYQDKLNKITFYLPYHPRPNAKPELPYERGNVVSGTKTDFDSVSRRLTRRFGDQAITTETYYVLLADTNRPFITTSIKNQTIEMVVSPAQSTR